MPLRKGTQLLVSQLFPRVWRPDPKGLKGSRFTACSSIMPSAGPVTPISVVAEGEQPSSWVVGKMCRGPCRSRQATKGCLQIRYSVWSSRSGENNMNFGSELRRGPTMTMREIMTNGVRAVEEPALLFPHSEKVCSHIVHWRKEYKQMREWLIPRTHLWQLADMRSESRSTWDWELGYLMLLRTWQPHLHHVQLLVSHCFTNAHIEGRQHTGGYPAHPAVTPPTAMVRTGGGIGQD